MTKKDTQKTVKELDEFITGLETYLSVSAKSERPTDPEVRIVRAQMLALARLVRKLT